MTRPRHVWLLFAACLAVAVTALVWLSTTALRLDALQFRAAQEAELEERVRLALWRMDSALALLAAEESALPWTAYDAFHPAERAYTRGNSQYAWGEVLVPSPLLGFASSNILLHFQFAADGPVASPEVPPAGRSALALASGVPAEVLGEAAGRLQRLQRLLAAGGADGTAGTNGTNGIGGTGTWRLLSSASRVSLPDPVLNRDAVVGNSTRALAALTNGLAVGAVPVAPAPVRQQALNDNEQQARASVFNNRYGIGQSAANGGSPAGNNSFLGDVVLLPPGGATAPTTAGKAPAASAVPAPVPVPAVRVAAGRNSGTAFELPDDKQALQVGPPVASWVGGELVLARRVNLADGFHVQGCWLNWPQIRQSLLASVTDLLPGADLRILDGPGAAAADSARPIRELVALAPVRVELLPGPVAGPPAPWLSSTRGSLLLAWIALSLAAGAVALLLHGAVSLSERRAAFVSAVTHELRTPLTTFKLYSEMLADDMVADPVQRRAYFDTLCSEANRLGHLVENVLAYARLERGSARRRVERLPLGELVARSAARLAERAAQVGLRLDTTAATTGPGADTSVHVDVAAVEQILFNLVDNACKYAAAAGVGVGGAALHVEILPGRGRYARLRVRDHGPGITGEVRERLFEPFAKSAEQAATSAPGVGLGLALCRRLSRSMGGNLVWDDSVSDGAAFILELPLAAGTAATL